MRIGSTTTALVTGGTGMLGSRIARLLHQQGARVRISYLPGDSQLAVEDLSVEHCPADLLDGRAVARALEGVEVVFHTAALVSFRPDLYRKQMHVNVEGTRQLLRAAARAGVRRLVHTSTVNTLGVPQPGAVADEETAFDWQGFRLGYMDSKREAERAVLEAVEQRAIDAVVVLPGTLFGPGDVNVNAGSYVRLVARSPVIPAPPGGTTVAHVDDVARGHLLALERGVAGERYILGGVPVSYRDLFACIAAELGRPGARVVTLPEGPLRVLGRLTSRLGGAGLARAACCDQFYSSEKAVRELGWSFRPVEQAVRDAVRWYRQVGLI
jgi:dihydroflavonol-4-reductase